MSTNQFSQDINDLPQKFSRFLSESADNLLNSIKKSIGNNYDEFEIVYFVEYVVCELFKESKLQGEAYWTIINDFLKNHLFKCAINIWNTRKETEKLVSPKTSAKYLNEINTNRTNRMNEYKNNYPLSEFINSGNEEIILKLINDVAINLTGKTESLYIIREGLSSVLLEYLPFQIEQQSKILISVLKNIEKGSKSKSGCFVASYIYGGYNTPQVNVLKRFRDYKLITNPLGRLFVKIYYRLSPHLVILVKKQPILKEKLEVVLDKFVDRLEKK